MTKYNEKYIIEQYLEGRTQKSIAIELDTYNTTIRRILKRNNISIRGNSEAQRQTNGNLFNNLNDEEVQYWLGFLSADGYIGKDEYVVGLSTSDKDKEHLKKYSEFVQVPIKTVIHKKFNVNENRVYFKNKEVNLRLRRIGITPNKSKTLELLIPLTPHILRGVIDGDGYVRKGKGTVEIATASERFSLQIANYLSSKGIKWTIHFKESVRVVGIYTQSEILKLYDLLYADATVFLERKKDRYSPLLRKLRGANDVNSGNQALGILSETSSEGRAETIIVGSKSKDKTKG